MNKPDTSDDTLRITPELLRSMGCVEAAKDNRFLLTSICLFEFRRDGTHWKFRIVPPDKDTFTVTHHVSHLSECFGMLYNDAFRDGRDSLRDDFRELMMRKE